jgi:hypothetical protein
MRGVRVRVRRDEYDVHENGGQDPGVKYNMEYNATNRKASTMRGVRVRVRRDEYDVHENGGQDPVGEYDGE